MNWISTQEELPKVGQHVLALLQQDGEFEIIFTKYVNNSKTFPFCVLGVIDSYCKPTHWMPISSQPERSKREDFVCDHECKWIHLGLAHKDGCTDPETDGECKTKMRCSEHCGNTVRDK